MQEPVFPSTITEKLYTERAILIATFVGGPLAGGYLLAQNFSTFNEPSRKNRTLLITGLVLFFVFGTGFIPFFDAVPGIAYSFTFCTTAHFAAKKFQGSRIQLHQSSGGAMHSTGRAVAVGFVCMLLMLVVIAGFMFLPELLGKS